MPEVDDLMGGPSEAAVVKAAAPAPVAAAPAAVAPVAAAAPAALAGQTTRTLPQYEMVSIDDEGAASRSEFDYYKGRKNITDRVGIADLKRIAAARVHYAEGPGLGFILCRSQFTRQETQGPDGRKLYSEVMVARAGCCELLGESTKKFAVPLVHYTTNPKGDLIKPMSFAMKVWKFDAGRFATLQQTHKEFESSGGLAGHDLKVTCADEQFQKLTIIACAESVLAHPKFKQDYGEGLTNWLNAVSPDLKRALGRDMSDDELRKKLGEASPGSGGAAMAPEVGGVASLDSLLS